MAISTAVAQTKSVKNSSSSSVTARARIWDSYGMLVIFAGLVLLASLAITNRNNFV